MSAERAAARAGWIFAATVLAWVLGSVLLPGVAQPQSYHAFADARTLAGIANFWNVVSNAAILVAGALGLGELLGHPQRFITRGEIWPYAAFFGSTVLVSLGSTYYHLAPDDARLFWDRMPIALATAALAIAVWSDHSGSKTVLRLLWPALVAGALSVIWWRLSARSGQDNLVPYLLLQLLAIAGVVWLTFRAGRYSRVTDLWVVMGIYVAARLAEVFDRAIFALGGILSGHTLKHLLAALAAAWVLRMIRLRQPVSGTERVTHA